jgi:putative ABC transport system permease protein
MEWLIKSPENPLMLAEAVRREVHALERTAVAPGFSTMEERIGRSLFERRFQTSLLSAFSLVALLLAAIGTYGVVHFSVQQRVREIGVRMVLGAHKLDVLWLVLGQGLKMVLAGVGVGIGLVFAFTRLMARLLFEIEPADPLTLAGAAALLTAVASLACWLPARRAARVDPMVALRTE